jgi:hypothetical protein
MVENERRRWGDNIENGKIEKTSNGHWEKVRDAWRARLEMNKT